MRVQWERMRERRGGQQPWAQSTRPFTPGPWKLNSSSSCTPTLMTRCGDFELEWTGPGLSCQPAGVRTWTPAGSMGSDCASPGSAESQRGLAGLRGLGPVWATATHTTAYWRPCKGPAGVCEGIPQGGVGCSGRWLAASRLLGALCGHVPACTASSCVAPACHSPTAELSCSTECKCLYVAGRE